MFLGRTTRNIITKLMSVVNTVSNLVIFLNIAWTTIGLDESRNVQDCENRTSVCSFIYLILKGFYSLKNITTISVPCNIRSTLIHRRNSISEQEGKTAGFY